MKSGMKTLKPIGGMRDRRHGTIGGYAYWSCRCDRCREANREAGRANRAEKLATLGPEDHGKVYTYICGCRCEPCKAAQRGVQLLANDRRPTRKTQKVELTDLV